MTETIGQRLKRAREYRHLTLEKAADATRIRLQYLRALEADDFSAMPSPVQARGFLRNYADYLGLDLEQIVEELRSAAPKPLPPQEVVFEGESASPVVEEGPRQAPAPDEALPLPGKQQAPLVSFLQGWLERLPRIRTAQAGQPVETQPQDIPPIEVVPSEREEQPAPRKSRRKKATPAPELDRQPALGPGPGPAPAPDAVPLASAESPPQEPPAAEGAAKALAVPAWRTALAWTGQRLSRRARPLPEGTEPEIAEAGWEESEADIPSPNASQPVESAQEIFDAIGSQLRQRREVLSLAHDEIERHTRMRAQFLAALEDGRIDDLPSPVQTRGMLSNYATFLDLDADALLLRFADALQAQRRERHPARPEQSRREKPGGRRGQPVIPQNLPRLRMFIAGDLVFGIGMIVLLVVFAIWGISRVVSVQSQQVEAEETAPSISEALIGTPVETVEAEATPIPVEDTPLPGATELYAPLEGTLEGTLEVPILAGIVNVQVNIVSIERSYLRVLVDGEVAFEGRTTPGTVYPFEAEGSIEVLAGNASALRIIYNQRDLGLLGGFGQLVNYVYTADEIVVPTPAASPTPTLTPFDTPTPILEASPPATPSPSPSPTIAPAGETF